MPGLNALSYRAHRSLPGPVPRKAPLRTFVTQKGRFVCGIRSWHPILLNQLTSNFLQSHMAYCYMRLISLQCGSSSHPVKSSAFLCMRSGNHASLVKSLTLLFVSCRAHTKTSRQPEEHRSMRRPHPMRGANRKLILSAHIINCANITKV